MALPILIAGAIAGGAALWEYGWKPAWAEAEDHLLLPGTVQLPGPPPAPAAPTSDQLRRGASWTPADVLERTRQQTRIYSRGIQAGARLSSSANAAAATAGSNSDAALYVLIGLGVVGGVLLLTR